MVRKRDGWYEPLPPGATQEDRMRSMEAAICDIGNRQAKMDESQTGLRMLMFGAENDPDDLGLKGEFSDIRKNQDRTYMMQKWIFAAAILILLIMGPQGIEHLLSLLKVVHP